MPISDIEKLAERKQAWRLYSEMLVADGHDNMKATSYGLAHTFQGLDFAGKRVLDIGSGKGLMTLFAALNQAETVVSMEPELEGSRSKVLQTQQERIEQLGLTNVSLLSRDFNAWDPQAQQFNVILSFSSINHIHESAHHALRHDETYQRYIEIARKMHSLLKPEGVAVVADACRWGFFSMLRNWGVRRPWSWNKPININWRIHQNPRVWKKIFLAAGFSRVNVIYPSPYKLRSLKAIVSRPLANFFLSASFTLHCHR